MAVVWAVAAEVVAAEVVWAVAAEVVWAAVWVDLEEEWAAQWEEEWAAAACVDEVDVAADEEVVLGECSCKETTLNYNHHCGGGGVKCSDISNQSLKNSSCSFCEQYRTLYIMKSTFEGREQGINYDLYDRSSCSIYKVYISIRHIFNLNTVFIIYW